MKWLSENVEEGKKERKKEKNMPLVELIQYYERFKLGRGVILHNGRGCSNLVWRWGVLCKSQTPTIFKGHFDRKRYEIIIKIRKLTNF